MLKRDTSGQCCRRRPIDRPPPIGVEAVDGRSAKIEGNEDEGKD